MKTIDLSGILIHYEEKSSSIPYLEKQFFFVKQLLHKSYVCPPVAGRDVKVFKVNDAMVSTRHCIHCLYIWSLGEVHKLCHPLGGKGNLPKGDVTP